MWVRVRHQTVTFHTTRHTKWPRMTRYRLRVQHIICQKSLLELHSLEIHSLFLKIHHRSSYCSSRSQQFWHLDFDQVADSRVSDLDAPRYVCDNIPHQTWFVERIYELYLLTAWNQNNNYLIILILDNNSKKSYILF